MKTESRMKRRRPSWASVRMLVVASVLTAGLASVRADEASCDTMAPSNKVICGVGHCSLWCPDDYVRKPAPCVFPVACCCADTYCHKPCLVLPCHAKCCCPKCCCPNDYCPKPNPSLCRPMANAWYKCVPLAPCHWLRPPTCSGNDQ